MGGYHQTMTTLDFTGGPGKLTGRGTALVTGASSGIGKAYATWIASKGYDLVITGRREDLLEKVADDLKDRYHVSVKTIIAELSDDKDLKALLKTAAGMKDIVFLVNNAGYSSGEEFWKSQLDQHLKMLNVHVVATLKLTYAVLPQMISNRRGTIINVSSLGAFTPAPGNTIYSGTKLFLNTFTESLYMEVKKYGIKLQCICPGYTYTDFHHRQHMSDNPGTKKILKWMEPETVVEKSMKALDRNLIIYIPGWMNHVLIDISRVIPRKVYYKIMERQTGNVLKESETN